MAFHRLLSPASSSVRGYAFKFALLFSIAALASQVEAEEPEIPFDVAEIFFELNNTDGDLGIHAMIDGGPWTRLEIEDPRGRRLMAVRNRGKLAKQGLTEFFFESAEPTFDELAPEDFFARFPEGIYEVEGRTQDGLELESEVQITHSLPAPAEPTVNGALFADVCDDEDPDYNPTVVAAGAPVVIAWPEVTLSHPDLGTQPPVAVEIVNYEVVAEVDLEIGGEEFTTVFSVVLPPERRSMTIPAEFLAQSDTFKYEVLAREASFNQTAVESCFVIE